MDPIQAALEDLRGQTNPNIAATAQKYVVNRSTLSRRFNHDTNPPSVKAQNQQLLDPQQERRLVDYINELTERGIPPTPAMVRNFAFNITGNMPGNSWSHRFCTRWNETIKCRYLKTIDFNRKNADRYESYQYFFDLLRQKLEYYRISTENQYNMDEKGFMIGVMNKEQRIFTKDTFQKGHTLAANQDGNREWITILATICADGTFLPPGILYQSKSGDIQAEWVEAATSQQHQAHVAPSETGWTSDIIAMHWLQEVFDRYTKQEATNGLKYRLLYIDGHGSHLNMNFIKWCDNNRIILAIYPPHSTHRLQPLDVSIFSPLSKAYSFQLTQHMANCQGLSKVSKKDFLSLFWPAFEKSFSPSNIHSAFRKTGLNPLDSEPVLSRLIKPSTTTTEDQDKKADRPASNHSSTSAISASDWRKIRTLFYKIVGEEKQEQANLITKMNNTLLDLTTRITLLGMEN